MKLLRRLHTSIFNESQVASEGLSSGSKHINGLRIGSRILIEFHAYVCWCFHWHLFCSCLHFAHRCEPLCRETAGVSLEMIAAMDQRSPRGTAAALYRTWDMVQTSRKLVARRHQAATPDTKLWRQLPPDAA